MVIVLDCSGSTYRNQALQRALGAVLYLLEQAYLQRSRTAMIKLYGRGVEIAWSPRRARSNPQPDLRKIRGGGGTPLGAGINAALNLLQREQRRFPNESRQMFLFTDGRSNDRPVSTHNAADIWVVDMESGPLRLQRCERVAAALNARLIPLDSLPVLG